MEISEHVTQILSQISGAVLEKSRFGRSEQVLFWLSAAKLPESAKALKVEGGFEFLENLSAMQVDENIVLSYFVRHAQSGRMVILRASVEAKGADEWVALPSVGSVWVMALPFEQEIARLFGVKFSGHQPETQWSGFPLRKSFVVTGGLNP